MCGMRCGSVRFVSKRVQLYRLPHRTVRGNDGCDWLRDVCVGSVRDVDRYANMHGMHIWPVHDGADDGVHKVLARYLQQPYVAV